MEERDKGLPRARQGVRRYRVTALLAVLAASVPYLWVLWDLWTGTVNPLRIDQKKTSPGAVIYDQQALAMLRGHLSLTPGSISIEAFIHDGRTYTYFGIFPSLIRMPILLATHSFDGHLSALSLAAAWLVTALFSTLLLWRIRTVRRGDAVLGLGEAGSYGVLLFSILVGSVLVSLASTPNAYTEDEAWGAALACGSLFALLGVVERPSLVRVINCGFLVLLTNLNRATTGYACVLATIGVSVWFALGLAGSDRRRWALPMFFVGFLALAAGCAIDYAKFSVLFGFPASEQLLYKAYGFGHINGGKHFSLHFVPSTLDAYLAPGNLGLSTLFPYLTIPALPSHVIAHTKLFNIGNTASVPGSMPLLFGTGLWGVITTFGRRRPTIVRSMRILIAASATTAASMFIYGTIYERFLGDFMPLLVLTSTIGLVDIWVLLARKPRSFRVVAVASGGILALFGFVANMGIAIGPQMNWTQTQADNFVRVQQAASAITGHPLSHEVVRDRGFPSSAPEGQLLIEGQCHELYLSYEAVPDGFTEPWLLVEREPNTPICNSLLAQSTDVFLGTTIVSPRSGAKVSGDVTIKAETSGSAHVTNVSIALRRGSALLSTKLGTARKTPAGWSLEWDSNSIPNGTYELISTVNDAGGYAAASAPVTVIVDHLSLK